MAKATYIGTGQPEHGKIVATFVGGRVDYEGKTYAQMVLCHSDLRGDPPGGQHARDLIMDSVADGLKIPPEMRDDDWKARWKWRHEPMTQEELDRYFSSAYEDEDEDV